MSHRGRIEMTPEQFRQIEALFHRGKHLPPEEQRALLDAECGDDAGVRAEVEKLLAKPEARETLGALRVEVVETVRAGVESSSAGADLNGDAETDGDDIQIMVNTLLGL